MHHEMNLKAIKPVHGGFTASRDLIKHLMLVDAVVVTNLEGSGIDKTNAATSAKAVFEIDTQRYLASTQRSAGSLAVSETPLASSGRPAFDRSA